jgi:hypothetical protein
MNGYYSQFGKEADRSFRQFQSALCLLRQFKSPPISVTVKTNTAFVAQNQQLNAMQNPTSTSTKSEYEINASK